MADPGIKAWDCPAVRWVSQPGVTTRKPIFSPAVVPGMLEAKALEPGRGAHWLQMGACKTL